MNKPFPPPPFPQKPVEVNDNPRLTDEETQFLLKAYLRPDQLDNDKLLKFIMIYLETRNAAQAAKEAGLQNGSYWRSRPEIHACIEAITAKAVMKYGYDASEMIERTKEIANIDPIEMQNPDGSFKTHLSMVKPEVRRAIKKLKVKNLFGLDANGMQIVIGQIIDYEFWDKMKGIEMLGSEKNIFKKTTVIQHDVTSNMQSLLLESGKRADERKQIMAREVGHGSGESQSGDSRESGRNSGGVPVTVGSGGRGEQGPGDDIEAVFRQEDGGGGAEGPL